MFMKERKRETEQYKAMNSQKQFKKFFVNCFPSLATSASLANLLLLAVFCQMQSSEAAVSLCVIHVLM